MTCQVSRAEVERCAAELVQTAQLLQQHVSGLLARVESQPLLLVGGEMNTWMRYALDAENLARSCREAAEEFRQKAISHDA